MVRYFPKQPLIIYNSIDLQNKTSPNSLTVAEWNRIINVLSKQTNTNTSYLDSLNKLLFGEHYGGDFKFDTKDIDGLLHYLVERKANVDANGLIHPSHIPGFTYNVVAVESLDPELHNNPLTIYVMNDKQYRWYAEGKWIEVLPFTNPVEYIEQILEEGFTIDCGEYGD